MIRKLVQQKFNLLCIIFISTLLVVSTNTYAEDIFIYNNIAYKIIKENEVEVTSILNAAKENIQLPDAIRLGYADGISVPDKFMYLGTEYRVTRLGDSAFSAGWGITSFNLPSSITSIGDYAFQNCGRITSIRIPDGVLEIGKYAFDGCGALSEIHLPDSLSIIQEWTFYQCINLRSIQIPQKVKRIDKDAFKDCPGLSSLFLLSVAPPSIVPESFYDATYDFARVYIPKEAENAYLSNSNWNRFKIISSPPIEIEGITYAITDENKVEVVPGTAFYKGTLSIPKEIVNQGEKYLVEKVGTHAFYHCVDLESIILSEGILSIGDYAFDNCQKLTSIAIPSSLKSIGNRSFSECATLSSPTLSKGVEKIGWYAFYKCENITSIEFSENIKDIGTNAFDLCTGIQSVTVNSVSPPLLAKNGFNNDTYTQAILYLPKDGYNAYSKHAEWGQFINKQIKGIFEKDGITYRIVNTDTVTVERGLYAGKITIPSTVTHEEKTYKITSLDEKAFYQCSELTSVHLLEGITAIGDSAFYQCGALISVDLPISLKTIGKSVFSYCYKLKSIDLPTDLISIGSYTFNCCIALTSATIPEGVTQLEEATFGGCEGLISVTLPKGLTSLNKWAFVYCPALTSIVLPEGLTSIGEGAFENCYGLVSVSNPTTLKKIGKGAFYHCNKMTTINLPEGLTEIEKEGFIDCKALSSIVLPNSLTNLGEAAFAYCENLTTINIPEDITSIEYCTFMGCGLTSIILPQSITNIGEYVFESCPSLVSVLIQANTPPVISSSTFKTYNSNTILYVPGLSLARYQEAPIWNTFDNIRAYDPNFILDPAAENSTLLLISSSEGNLSIISTKVQEVILYNESGKAIYHLHLQAGENRFDNLLSGIYIVKGEKIQVR